MTPAPAPRPSNTRAILSSTAWALLGVAACLVAVAALAAWRCPDSADVLVEVASDLGWVALALGGGASAGALARKLPGLRGAVSTPKQPTDGQEPG